MSDAPRWPGADGSPGLDFSRKPKGDDAPPNDASTPKAEKASDPVDTEVTRDLAAEKVASAPRNTTEAPKPSSQQIEDWKLEGITRPAKPSTPAPAATPSPAAPASTTNRPTRLTSASDETIPTRAVQPTRRTRKARLRITRFDPWSVMKTSFLFSIAFGVMFVAGISVLGSVFNGSDPLNYINDLINSVIADPEGGNRFNIHEFLGWQRVVGLAALLAAIDVVIFTAVATLFAFLYNLSAVIMGGLEMTLAED